MLKQRFVYIISKRQADTNQLYTAYSIPVTLLQTDDGNEKSFKFNGKICGSWIAADDGFLLFITFRGGGNENLPKFLHVFEPTGDNHFKLLDATDEIYKAFPDAEPHRNTDVVQLLRIPDFA